MENETNVLPADFDGVFRFTNFSKEDFVSRWDSVEYTFPSESSIPLIIPNATPFEIQSIRKKFARELAEREWYQTPKFKSMNSVKNGAHPALYTESDLAPFIQRCLEPMPLKQAVTKVMPKDSMKNYPNSVILKDGQSAIQSLDEKPEN